MSEYSKKVYADKKDDIHPYRIWDHCDHSSNLPALKSGR